MNPFENIKLPEVKVRVTVEEDVYRKLFVYGALLFAACAVVWAVLNRGK